MASRSGKEHNRRRVSGASRQGASAGRMHEVLGLVVMTLAFLIGLALVTYNASDDAIVRGSTLSDAFIPGENQISNALGLAGAWIAGLLVPRFLGYPIVLLAGLVCMAGYLLFRRRLTGKLVSTGILVFVVTFTVASLFGWIALVFEVELTLWSGRLGLGVAGWLQHVLGTIGSAVILSMSLAIAILLLVDHDLQRMFDRVGSWFASVKAAAGRRRAAREKRAEAKRKEKQAKRKTGDSEDLTGTRHERPSSKTTAPAPPGSSRTLNDTFQGMPPPARSTAHGPATEKDIEIHVQQRVEEEHADIVERQIDIPREKLAARYRFPTIDLLDERDADEVPIDYDELEENKRILLDKLDTYGIEIRDINAIVGPTVTLYELTPAPGVKINRITASKTISLWRWLPGASG